MYVYRFGRNGTKINSKPCAECTRWILCAELVGVKYELYHVDDKEELILYDSESPGIYHPYQTYF